MSDQIYTNERIGSCNRHSDCAKADRDYLANYPDEKFVPLNFHCYDEECEDCFGC